MTRVNIDILGISELRWTGMGEFNSDNHYIYYCGQESLRRNGIALIINKGVQNTVLGCSLKNNRMISVIQAYSPTTDVREAEIDQFCEDLQPFLELPHKIYVCFITGDWKAEIESQKIPRITGKASVEV